MTTVLATGCWRAGSTSPTFRDEVAELFLIPYPPAVRACAGGSTPLRPSFFTAAVLFYGGEYHPEYVLASYSLVFHMVRIRVVNLFAERCRLQVMGASDWVRYVGFLNVAYPYCINLGAGISSAGVRFVVDVPVVVFAGAVMPKPAGWRPPTSFGGAVPFFWLFSFLSAVRRLRFAFAVVTFSSGAGEFLLVRVACVWYACRISAVFVEHWRK